MNRLTFKKIELLAILIPSLIVCGNSMAGYANPALDARNKFLENRHACFMVLANKSFTNLDGLCGIGQWFRVMSKKKHCNICRMELVVKDKLWLKIPV